jgi:thymidylate synthase
MRNTKDEFNNATEAFDYFLTELKINGTDFDGTKALFNVGFYILNPKDKVMNSKKRKFNEEYAKAEWDWYLSGDPSIDKLGDIYGKVPAIWEQMALGPNNLVNSNYGYQWERGYQLDKVVAILKNKPDSRKAAISIYDGKEIIKYRKDTPCTYAVQFTIIDNRLNMSVYMRSNDIWYGFCNDQYQFASLQEMVAERLSIDVGWYYHHAHNLHLYKNKI